MTEADFQRLDAAAMAEVDEAVAFAEAGTWEAPENWRATCWPQPEATTMPATTYREALRAAHREALKRDPRVFVMGEDVGRYGGTYAVTKGLLDEFGPEARIRDTPLSELGFVGAGIGAALGGMRPIVEIMTVNFSLLALDAIVNTRGAAPHVRRAVRRAGGDPHGHRRRAPARRAALAQPRGWYAHVPGIKVLAPATVRMRAACCGRRWPIPTRW
jgi:pyruvate/2-oxoglutarate/acetoin dehydrogenase E1 component